MESKNFMQKLNGLNNAMGVASAVGNKYDYAGLGIAKNLQMSFRKKMRKLVCNFYANENVQIADAKEFAEIMQEALLQKTPFASLPISAIYPNFTKLPATMQTTLTAKHKSICKMLAPAAK